MNNDNIQQQAEEITTKLYASFGTDSGILFGIKDKDIVTMIVGKAIKYFAEWQSGQPTVAERKKDWSYCQREIEGESICSEQCDHCKEY